MFYKEKLITKEIRELYENKYHLEFALALKDKFNKNDKEIDIYELKNNNGFKRYLAVENTLSDRKDVFMLGDYTSTGDFFIEDLEKTLKIDNLKFNKLPLEKLEKQMVGITAFL